MLLFVSVTTIKDNFTTTTLTLTTKNINTEKSSNVPKSLNIANTEKYYKYIFVIKS